MKKNWNTPRTMEEAFGIGSRLEIDDGPSWKDQLIGFVAAVAICAPFVIWVFYLLTE